MLQSLHQYSNDTICSSSCTSSVPRSPSHENCESNHPKPVQKRIAMVDIPDEIVGEILEFYVMTPKHNVGRIRLVNKRLAALALSCTMRTISVSSPEGFVKLFSAGHSPVYNEHLGKHVRCFELAFISRIPKVVDIGDRVSPAFPNLNVIRFKFTIGVLIYAGESLQALLAEDTLFRSSRMTRNSVYRFLGELRPQRFEWVSPDGRDIYLVGVYPKLRSLFRSWNTLSSIYLEGICLVEQRSLATWNFALFADRVHIKGAFSNTEPVILGALRSMRDSKSCRLLLLEESWPMDKRPQEMMEEHVAVLTFGNTMVSLKHWSTLNRQRLKACATGRSMPPYIPENISSKVAHIDKPTPPATQSTVEFVLLVSLCAILGILHAIGPHHTLMNRTHLSLFDIFGGPYEFNSKSIFCIICRDGSYLGERYCSSDSSLWFLDRSLMLHPT